MEAFFNGMMMVGGSLIGLAFLSMILSYLFKDPSWKLRLADGSVAVLGAAVVIAGIGLVGAQLCVAQERAGLSIVLRLFGIGIGVKYLRQLYGYLRTDRAWKKYLKGDKQ